MHSSLLVLILAAAPPAEVAESSNSLVEQQDSAPAKQRTRAEWVDEVRGALRHQAGAEDIGQPQAYVRLISLYQELLKDKSLHHSERSRLRNRLRGRLLRLTEEFYHDLRRRENRIEVVRRRAEVEKNPEKLKLIEEDEAVLTQWGGMLGQVLGGGGGGRAEQDHGEDLVELIERVIAPDFWDANGGPGRIVYYKNLKVLVISATSEVHEQIGGGRGGLLDKLRRAG
ncbi:MAG: hypothetical protein VB835_15020, partial [Pirellulales bacterium]